MVRISLIVDKMFKYNLNSKKIISISKKLNYNYDNSFKIIIRLLEYLLKKDKVYVLTNINHLKLSIINYFRFICYLYLLKKEYPIEYIIKRKNFYENSFFVNKNVLIPRPETEFLVDAVLKIIKIIIDNKIEKYYKKESKQLDINILEIGTGSGCVIISILEELIKKYKIKTINLKKNNKYKKSKNSKFKLKIIKKIEKFKCDEYIRDTNNLEDKNKKDNINNKDNKNINNNINNNINIKDEKSNNYKDNRYKDYRDNKDDKNNKDNKDIKKREKSIEISFFASDISRKSLKVAKINEKKIMKGNYINWIKADIIGNNFKKNILFDIIFSNPPYISKNDFRKLDKRIRKYEPRIALLSNDSGDFLYKKIYYRTRNILKKGGYYIFEVGDNRQAKRIINFYRKNNFKYDIVNDYSGTNRILILYN